MKRTITVPHGIRTITFEFQDDEPVEKHGAASVSLAEMNDARKATGLDILRMRGTPLLMIHSTIEAGDIETANAMFRTTILEYVYEKIAATYPCDNIQFINSRQLQRGPNDSLGLEVEGEGGAVIGLTPEFDTIGFMTKGFAPLCTLDAGHAKLDVTDDGDASIMSIIEGTTEIILDLIRDGIGNANIEKSTGIHFRIGTDLSTVEIKSLGRSIEATVCIAMLAFIDYTN